MFLLTFHLPCQTSKRVKNEYWKPNAGLGKRTINPNSNDKNSRRNQ
jgi:hypothetical protein